MGAFDPVAFQRTHFDAEVTAGLAAATAEAQIPSVSGVAYAAAAGGAVVTAGAANASVSLAPAGKQTYLIHAVRTEFLGGLQRRCYVEFSGIQPSASRLSVTWFVGGRT